jgi:hypothetical protein
MHPLFVKPNARFFIHYYLKSTIGSTFLLLFTYMYPLFVKPSARFFIHYFIRLGFLDGFTGFLVVKTQVYGVLTRDIKLWLLNSEMK